MIPCPERERLRQWRDGRLELTEAEEQALEAHVESCPQCQPLLAEDEEITRWRQLLEPELPTFSVDFTPWMGEARLEEPAFPFAPPAQPGQLGQLEHYQIVRRLGSGAMGVVFEGFDTRLKRRVAVKVLRPELGGSASFHTRIEREARSAAAVHHEHVVVTYDVAVKPPGFPLPYLVQEYVAGETLAERLRRQQVLSAAEAATIIRQVAEGLAAAHERGVVHRDVKPSNILLEAATGRAKVSDFGLARAMDGSDPTTRTGQLVGTPAYMSPEQAVHPERADGRGDVFGLGVVLYELITGERPFRGTTPTAILQQVIHEEPVALRKLNVGVPRDLETIVLKCLAKEPNRRYASAAALAEDLRRFQTGQHILARPVGRGERLWRWCRRNPMASGLAAAVALLLLLVAGGGVTAAFWFRDLANRAEVARQKEIQAQESLQTNVAEMHVTHGLLADDRGDWTLPPVWFAAAVHHSRHHPSLDHFNRLRFGNWSRAALRPIHVLPHDGLKLAELAYHPGGKHLLTRTGKFDVEKNQQLEPGHCYVWDLETERPLPWLAGRAGVQTAHWSRDGRRLALALADNTVQILDFPSGQVLYSLKGCGPTRYLTFSSNDKWLAAGGGDGVRLWGGVDFKEIVHWKHPQTVYSVDIGPDDDRLVSGCADGLARVFRVDEDKAKTTLIFPPVPHQPSVFGGFDQESFHVFPGPIVLVDGSLLTITKPDLPIPDPADKRTLSRWDAKTGSKSKEWNVGFPLIRGLTRCPRTYRVMVTGYYEMVLLDAETLAQVGDLCRHGHAINSVIFGPTGGALLEQEIVSASNDRLVSVWGRTDWGPRLQFQLQHQMAAELAVLSPDGRCLATSQINGLVQIWRRPEPDDRHFRIGSGSDSYASGLTLSGDGRFVTETPLRGWQVGPGHLRRFQHRRGQTGPRAAGPAAGPPGLLG